MTYYANLEVKRIDAIHGNSKARQARVLFDFSREFKGILPAEVLEQMINAATNIICGKEFIKSGDVRVPEEIKFEIPRDEADKLLSNGYMGKVFQVKILRT